MDVMNVDVSGFKFPFCKRSLAILEYYFVDVILEKSWECINVNCNGDIIVIRQPYNLHLVKIIKLENKNMFESQLFVELLVAYKNAKPCPFIA